MSPTTVDGRAPGNCAGGAGPGTLCAVLQLGADGGFHALRWCVSDCSWIISNTYICVWFNLCTLALCEKTAADQWLRKLNTSKRSKIREETRAASSKPQSCLGCFQESPGKNLCSPCSVPRTAPLLNPPPRQLQQGTVQHPSPPAPLSICGTAPLCHGSGWILIPTGCFPGDRAGKVPGGLGTVPLLFTPTSFALLNTLSPPHRHPGCWPLPRGIYHGRRAKKGGAAPH